MNKRIRARALELFSLALDTDLGLRVRTNDASRLQAELAQVRVQLRKDGIRDYDILSFRVMKEKDAPSEYVFITKKLSQEEVIAIIGNKNQGDKNVT